MKNVIENLKMYFQSFINLNRDWDFFLGLADYVKFIIETPETDGIVKLIIKQKSGNDIKIKKYENEAIEEIKKAKNLLLRQVKNSNISYDILNNLINKYQNHEVGKTSSTRTKAEALGDCLNDIIRNLYENGHKETVKDFINIKDGILYTNKHNFSKKLDLYYKEREIYDDKSGIEEWGAWGNLSLVYIVVYKWREEIERLNKDSKNWWTVLNLNGLAGEMKDIREGKITNRLTGTTADFEPVYFIRENYIRHATRIHNYLTKELSKKESEKTTERQIKEITLYLNPNGDLYKEPKEKYCYPMGENGDRYKTVRFLAENRGYQQTIEISSVLGDKNIKSVQTEIYKINNIAIGKLEIKNKLIEGKKGSGYRINPKYKIILKNE